MEFQSILHQCVSLKTVSLSIFWENDQVHLGEVYFQNEEKTKKKQKKQTVNQSFKDYSKPP